MSKNYSNGVVYQFRCKDIFVKHTYIGSTVDFKKRNKQHEYDYLNVKKRIERDLIDKCDEDDDETTYPSFYKFIYENGGWDNWYIIALGNYNCDTRVQLLAMEHHWIENLKILNIPLLNKNRALSKTSVKKINKIFVNY
jgi:hypothetical protein